MKLFYIGILAGAVLAAIVFMRSIPDLKRYMRMEQM